MAEEKSSTVQQDDVGENEQNKMDVENNEEKFNTNNATHDYVVQLEQRITSLEQRLNNQQTQSQQPEQPQTQQESNNNSDDTPDNKEKSSVESLEDIEKILNL